MTARSYEITSESWPYAWPKDHWPQDRRYYCPEPGTYPPYLPPAQPRGRWVWLPEPTYGCDACRLGGVCSCYRPSQGPVI